MNFLHTPEEAAASADKHGVSFLGAVTGETHVAIFTYHSTGSFAFPGSLFSIHSVVSYNYNLACARSPIVCFFCTLVSIFFDALLY